MLKAYGSRFVCLSICLSVCRFFEACGNLNVDTCNIGTAQQCLKTNSLGIYTYESVFSLWCYSLTSNAVVVCSRFPRWSTCLPNSSFVPRPNFLLTSAYVNVMSRKTDQGLGTRLAKLQKLQFLTVKLCSRQGILLN